MAAIVLNGITWGHSRGITPLLAISQRYTELHPDIEIRWTKRTLQQFADFPIEKLTHDYDLLIIDHPWVGCAAATGCVLPLNEYLSAAYLDDQLQHTVGYSHKSYEYDHKQWALAIDAATPAASYRPDLLQQNNAAVPQHWEELIAMAKAGKVAVPAIPIDLLMNFYSFCIALGEQPFRQQEYIISQATGIAAIERMKELYHAVDPIMFRLNPIGVAELMTTTDQYWYCPFAYGYSNYSREGYAAQLLQYTDVISIDENKLRTTIGGTGLAVSAFSKHREQAIGFTAMAVSGEWQRSLYVQHGGQPGHRLAWEDDLANRLTTNFFTHVLPVMQNGYVRPRYNGYLHFQDEAGIPLQQCIQNNSDAGIAIRQMNKIYQQSLQKEHSTIAL